MHEGTNSKQIIWLCDNDEDDRIMLHEALLLLNRSAFEIIELCSAEQLMERFSRADTRFPDFIFLDLHIYCMTGFDCIEQIRKHDGHRRIKIIVCTAGSFDSAIERAFLLGADFYAVKPNSCRGLKDLANKFFRPIGTARGQR